MNSIIKLSTLALIVASFVFLFSGMIFMILDMDQLSADSLLMATATFPLFLVSKGLQFHLQKQKQKVLVSLAILSIFCILTLIFVFMF